jgi:hypothetical protein
MNSIQLGWTIQEPVMAATVLTAQLHTTKDFKDNEQQTSAAELIKRLWEVKELLNKKCASEFPKEDARVAKTHYTETTIQDPQANMWSSCHSSHPRKSYPTLTCSLQLGCDRCKESLENILT